MRTTRSDLEVSRVRIESRAGEYAADQRVSAISDDTACNVVQALVPSGSRKKIWDKNSPP